MRIFCFAVLLIEVSAAFANSNIMYNNNTDRSKFIKTIKKLRVTRCSPKLIKPIMKRIAPAWSLKDLYETGHPATEDKSNAVEPLTTGTRPVTQRNEIILYIPYTRRTTTGSTMETITEDTSTQAGQQTRMNISKSTEMKSVFFFLTTTRTTNNKNQKKTTKLYTSPPPKKMKSKKTQPKITKKTKAHDKEEISFNFLSGNEHEYDDVDHTNYTVIKAIEQLNNQSRATFSKAINNDIKRTPRRYNITTTPSITTKTSNVKEIFGDIIKKHLKDFHNEDLSMVKRYNHQESATLTTSSWNRKKGAKRIASTPETDAYIDANHRQNTRQLNARDFYRSGHVVDKLKHVLLNYDISRRPEQRPNSLQKFGLVYVPVPLKLMARYNNLNHYPVNPRLQVLLSNYGYYLPGSFGIRRFGLYNHLAYNNIYAKKPFGDIYRNNIDPDA